MERLFREPFLFYDKFLNYLRKNLNLGMTKGEIRDALKAKGLLDKTGTRDPLWVEAFSAHYKETKVKLGMSCGGCWDRVRRWLNS